MLSHYHHGGCETVHAEREAWRKMRRNRKVSNYKCSSKETYFIVSVRIRKHGDEIKLANGGEFCDVCYNFLKSSQISYGYEFKDGEFQKVMF